MPLYDFDCPACGHSFEALVPAGTAPPCAACGAEGVQRRFSPISPPARLGLRGGAKRDSEGRRGEREAAARERFKAGRARKRQS